MQAKDLLEEFKLKHSNKEFSLEENLNRLDNELSKLKELKFIPNRTGKNCKTILTYEEVKTRNQEIIKEISIAKARLRSRAIYNPAEITWCSIMQNYKNEPSLPVMKWQCCDNACLE